MHSSSPLASVRSAIAAVLGSVIVSACSGGGSGITVTPTTPTGPTTPTAPTVAFIRFVAQPGNATAGQTLSVSVELVSSSGARVTTASDAVTLTISGSASLNGTASVSAASGLATFGNVSVRKAGVGHQITATSGSFTATSNAFSISAAAVDPAQSIVSPTSFTANVATTLTFTFRDQYSNPTPSVTVSLATTAAGSTFTPASGTTGVDGTFVTSFRTTSGGAVTLTATAGGVTVPFATTVTSTLGTVNVSFRDAGGTLIPSVTYTLTYSGGSQQFTSTTGSHTVTNVPAGAVSVTASKTGFTTAAAAGTVVAGGTLTLNVVMAVASNACTPVAMAFPGTLNSSLTSASCLEGTQATAWYQFTVGSSQGVRFVVTPSGFAPLLAVTQSPPASYFTWTNTLGTPVGGLWLLPPGTYRARVSSTSGLGTFTFAGAAESGSLTTSTVGGVAPTTATSCPAYATLLVPITVAGQTLASTDCREADNSYYDTYYVYSANACTITMRSAAFDAYLAVYDATTGALVRSDDDSGGGTDAMISLAACNNSGNILVIHANSFLSARTGAYTLSLAISGTTSAVALGGGGLAEMRVDRRSPAADYTRAVKAKGATLSGQPPRVP